MRELRVLWRAFRTTLQTRLEYRADLALGLLGAFGLQASSLGMLWVLLHASGGGLCGWNSSQIGVLYGMTALVQGTSELFFNHIWWTPTYIVRGQFDRLLVYPVRSLPFFLMTCPELHALGNLSGGLFLTLYFGHAAGLSAAWIVLLPFWVVCGSFVHTSVLVIAGAATVRVQGAYNQLFWLVNTSLQNSRYPLTVYPGALRLLLLTLVPLAVATFIPVSSMTGRLPLWPALVGPPLAAAAAMAAAFRIWDWAFEGYESTGS
jgi:ABC-2 type transport system permease protein